MSDFFLADDLSGAFDAGAAFLRAGRAVRIVLNQSGWDGAIADEMVGYTTETRNLPPETAAARVRTAISAGTSCGRRLIYKKIDSTLRGPVAAELATLLNELPAKGVLFAPANPRVGRTVVNGVLLVRGVPVADTEFGHDPKSPLRSSAIRQILASVPLGRVVVPDIQVEADFVAAATDMDRRFGDWVGVGSGALAALAAERMGDPRPAARVLARAPISTGVLLVGGSAHPLNGEQAHEAAEKYGVSIWRFAQSATAGVSGDLRQRGVGIVCAPSKRIAPAECLGLIADSAAELIRTEGVRRLFVTGGETAYAVCERLGIASMHLLAEVEPGLTLASTEHAGDPLLLAIKPGGFGDRKSWIRAAEALKPH